MISRLDCLKLYKLMPFQKWLAAVNSSNSLREMGNVAANLSKDYPIFTLKFINVVKLDELMLIRTTGDSQLISAISMGNLCPYMLRVDVFPSRQWDFATLWPFNKSLDHSFCSLSWATKWPFLMYWSRPVYLRHLMKMSNVMPWIKYSEMLVMISRLSSYWKSCRWT